VEIVQAGRHHHLIHGDPSHDDIRDGLYRVLPGIVSQQDIRQTGGNLKTQKPGYRGFSQIRATRRVFKPACAILMLRFTETRVFPSWGEVLVMAMVLIFFSSALNWILVLRARKLSAIMVLGAKWETRCTVFRWECLSKPSG